MTDPRSSQPDRPVEPVSDAERRRGEVTQEIHRLHRQSNKGLWGLAVFILISIGAQQNFGFFPPIPESAREVLGASPPVRFISIALVVYSFSALILILSRMMGGSDTYRGWSHLGYLTGFYAFYYYAEALPENFWAIFVAGITIMSLEYYLIWTYCSEAIRKEKEILERLHL